MEIKDLEIKFEQQNLAFEKILTKLTESKKEILFPVSNKILRQFSSNMSLIFVSIIDNGKDSNLYPSMILYRSLIEHFFRAYYIFEKTLYSQSDEVAKEFEKYYLISEVLAEKAGVLDMQDLQMGNLNKTDFIQFLVTKFPQFEGFDKENQKEISAIMKQFGLKEIIKNFYKSHKNKSDIDTISQIIPEYSKVSTFTHGGMYANFLMDQFSEKDLTQNELERIAQVSLISIMVIKEAIIMTYYPDQDTFEFSKEINSFRPINWDS